MSITGREENSSPCKQRSVGGGLGLGTGTEDDSPGMREMHCLAGQKSGSQVWEHRNGGRGAPEASTGSPTRHEAGDWVQVPGGL